MKQLAIVTVLVAGLSTAMPTRLLAQDQPEQLASQQEHPVAAGEEPKKPTPASSPLLATTLATT